MFKFFVDCSRLMKTVNVLCVFQFVLGCFGLFRVVQVVEVVQVVF